MQDTSVLDTQIHKISSLAGYQQSLNHLLVNSVNNGASIGFIAPLTRAQSDHYWHSIECDLLNDSRELFVITEGSEVIGAVQLALCQKANGAHRGEVEKLMVHSQYQGQGFAKQLMHTLEKSALQHQLKLLVLDTRLGDVASRLYKKLGYIEAGEIPQFALSSSGELQSTVLFYKLLGAPLSH